MNNRSYKKTLTILFAILTMATIQGQIFKGTIKDSDTKEPIPAVSIYLPELNSGLITDINGIFEVQKYPSNNIDIHISFIGYETKVLTVDLTQIQDTTIYLIPSHFKLEEVVISVPGGKLQGDNIVLVDRIHLDELKVGAPASLAEAITRIPGIDTLERNALKRDPWV